MPSIKMNVCVFVYNQNMIRLCLSAPGTGKSHWLASQRAQVFVACTNKSHRSILAAVADDLHISYSSRASIDDLISLIFAHPPTKLAFDDIDRTAVKFCYSLLTLSQKHEIYCTATEKRRIKPLLDRQAAIIEPPPPAPIAEIVANRYPDLPPAKIRRIAALAQSPAAALNIAESVKRGAPLPAPPTQSLFPVLLILSLAALAFIRYYSDFDFSPVTLALISGFAFYLRRLLWKKA